MEAVSSLFAVAFVSLLAAISPGPDFFIVVKNSLSYSRKMGFMTSFGVAAALLIHLTYTIIGIAILITEGSVAYHILKYTGAAYLFYLGCNSLISSFQPQKNLELCYAGNARAMESTTAFKQGFVTNLLNPKCALFFMSLFSQFITENTPAALKFAYAGINWLITLAWFLFLSYVITGNWITSRVNRFRILIDRVMGIILMLLSLKLLF